MREPAQNSTLALNRRQATKAMAAFVIAPGLLKPLPFVPQPMPGGLDGLRLKAKVWLDPIEVVRAYRTALIKMDDSLFMGPAIEDAIETETGIVLKVQRCLVKKACHVKGIRLFHPSGEPRGDYGFVQFQTACPGDDLIVTVTANMS